jgi:hypothetical protein
MKRFILEIVKLNHSVFWTMSARGSPSLTQEITRARSVRKPATIRGAVTSLQYAGQSIKVDPVAHLSSLTDARSTHQAVARSCLQLNQFVGSDQSPPLHDTMYAKTMDGIFCALIECIQSHQDRRCRILAAKTLALCARATYAKVRHSPLLFSIRDGTLHRLEDEVGTDIPVALCTAALDDQDDGVAASAVEALGILTLSSSAMAGTLVDDSLLRQIESISHNRPSPFSPSLADLSDEDPSVSQMELQSRVYENVLLPRIWRLTKRIVQFPSHMDILRTIPFITSTFVHLVKLMPNSTLGIDRATYAKRWIEVDILALVTEFVNDLIIPVCQSGVNSGLAFSCALAGLRLADICPHTLWTRTVCTYCARVFIQELSASPMVVENTISLLAAILISLRPLSLADRMMSLEVVTNELRFLPATTLVPSNVTSPGIMIGKFIRRSARMGIMTEIALSIMIDGPSEGLRSKHLKDFLSSQEVSSLLISRRQKKNNRKWTSSNSTSSTNDGASDTYSAPGGKTPIEAFTGTHVAEEFVLAFCSVASSFGRKVMRKSHLNRHAQEWLRCSVAILSSACSACVNWKPRTTTANEQNDFDDTIESAMTMLSACQASYVQLLFECFHAVGFLSPESSIALHLLPKATPPRFLLLEELAFAASSLGSFPPFETCPFALMKDIANFADQFLEYKFREGIPSRHMRVALIAIFTDHWVQCLENESSVRTGDPLNMNDMNARELLTALSSEISLLSKSLHERNGNDQVNLHYLVVCTASVENIALMACDWARRHGTNKNAEESYRADIDDDAAYIVSTAIAALEGKNLRESDVLDGQETPPVARFPMLPICTEAVKRIQSVSSFGKGANNQNNYGAKPALHSLLVTTVGSDFKRRLSNNKADNTLRTSYSEVLRSPFIEADPNARFDEPLVVGDSEIHANFAYHCLQLIGSRIDQSLQASLLLDVDSPVTRDVDGEEKEGVIRSRNWLRLQSCPINIAPSSPLASRVTCLGAVKTLSGASDPVTFVIAYTMRRCMRYDCELQFKAFVTLRVHNVTAVSISQGVRMDLRITQQKSAFEVEDDDDTLDGAIEDHVLAAHTAVFKQEIKPNEQVTWEVGLENWPFKGILELHPSVTFRETETEHVPPKMVSATPIGKVENVHKGEDSKKQEEDDSDIQTDDNSASVEERTIGEDEDESTDITLTAEPVQLSPVLGLQPCPLVFFRGRSGDINTFRFLWYQMPKRMEEIILYPNQFSGKLIGSSSDDFAAAVARISCIQPINEPIEGLGVVTKGWAFMTMSRNHLLCLMIERISNETSNGEIQTSTLHFRADDEALLFSVLGSDSTRNAVVASLTGNQWACADGDNLYF